MRAIPIALFVILIPTFTFAQGPQDGASMYAACRGQNGTVALASQRYFACMAGEAEKLEPSGASPSDIAEAAAARCIEAGKIVHTAIEICNRAFQGVGLGDLSNEKAESLGRKMAINAVLTRRAQLPSH